MQLAQRSKAASAIAPFALLLAVVPGAIAVDLSSARSEALGWLESHQSRDGSWGAEPLRPLITAEVLLALAEAGHAGGSAGSRATAWLLNQETVSLDYRSRAIRALARAGVPMGEAATALDALANTGVGWGPTAADGVTSFDSALAMSAIHAAGEPISNETGKRAEVMSRRRSDNGWSGDGVPVDPASASDRTVSAEIVRGLAPLYSTEWSTPGTDPYTSQKFLSTDSGEGGAHADSSSDSLELASRLAALHAVGVSDAGLEEELLADVRFTSAGVWSDTDPYLNAIGLLALTTKPGQTFLPACTSDADCDGVLDHEDAFPYDAGEQHDSDGDGTGDEADTDLDGDGRCDPSESGTCYGTDEFPSDPTEHTDTDGDGLGDNADTDDDDDGSSDLAELAAGTDPTNTDTDGDAVTDDLDACPRIAGGTDQDGDGVCTPIDECDVLTASAFDVRDLDGDGTCDGADTDDDGDGTPDEIELITGHDPRDETDVPPPLVAGEDFDGDGVVNADEDIHGTSAYHADTDRDGATDDYELSASTDPNLASSQPPAIIAVMSSVGAVSPGVPGDPFEPALADAGGLLRMTVTNGQSTPVALPGSPQHVSSLDGIPGATHLAGFQPQTTRGRDFDGDGLTGDREAALRTNPLSADTDRDFFVDGAGGLVPTSAVPGGWDLDGDGFVDGEADHGTSPTDQRDRAGKPGDTAPLGNPDAIVNAADALVELRIVGDPLLTTTLPPQNRQIADAAADMDGNGVIDVADALAVLRAASLQGD